MKLLLIDYISPQGHIIFDHIHIQALLSAGYDLHLVGRKGQFADFVNKGLVTITEIPEKYYRYYKRFYSLMERIKGVLSLFWIKKNLNLRNFDGIVFLSYDILSLYFFRTSVAVYLINHNNVDQFNSRIKLSMTRDLPSNFIQIALNDYMEDELKRLLPKRKVCFVPHGFLEPTNAGLRPKFINDGDRFIFCPVNRNYDSAIINDIIQSATFKEYLNQNRIQLYIKSQLCQAPEGNIRLLPYLSEAEYNYMLSNAVGVILPYGGDFRYRCSGILFECVARNTPILATERKALKIYKDEIDIHYFDSVHSLLDAIDVIKSAEKKCNNYNIDKFQPLPYWKGILG